MVVFLSLAWLWSLIPFGEQKQTRLQLPFGVLGLLGCLTQQDFAESENYTYNIYYNLN